MATSLSDIGVQFAGGNIVDTRTTMPSTGSYTAGDLVLETSTAGRVSGWKRQTTGSAHVLGTDWVYFSGLTLGTTQNTTSGTTLTFSSIPSWVKRIIIEVLGVSTSGTSNWGIKLGTAGGIESTGYTGRVNNSANTSSAPTTIAQTVFSSSAATTSVGVLVLALVNSSTNQWVISGTTIRADDVYSDHVGFYKSLSGVLTQIQLATVNGTDTFDAGSVNIIYEG